MGYVGRSRGVGLVWFSFWLRRNNCFVDRGWGYKFLYFKFWGFFYFRIYKIEVF